jgi:DNA-binding CsgD family transcriptional regulator/PAS domain-containing protein
MSEHTSANLPVFGDLRDAVALSPLAMLVFSLPDQRVRLVNEPAARLFGTDRTTMIGRPVNQLLSGVDTAKADVAMSALSTGALDSYRARRRLRADSGPVDAWMWVRTLRVPSGSMAVAIVVPESEAHTASRSIGAFFGPDALDLAVGTTDATGRIERITPNSRVMLGRDQAELAGTTLMELAHPEDVDRLASSLRGSTDNREQIVVKVRMRHAARGWTEVRCLFFPLPENEPPRIAFVLAAPGDETQTGLDPERLAQLEGHLLRIAAEVHGAGLADAHPFAVDASRFPALNELSTRQREIVDRLLRNERIPAIASSMYLSPSTVRNHLSHVFHRFGVHSQSELLSLLRSDLSASPT